MEGLTTVQSNFAPAETINRLEAEIRATSGQIVSLRHAHVLNFIEELCKSTRSGKKHLGLPRWRKLPHFHQ